MLRNLPEGLALRPAQQTDRAFLREVFDSTRRDELAPLPWSEDEKRTFLERQFNAQDTQYRDAFPPESFMVILVGGADAGRLYLDRNAHELHVVDIALLPAFRGRGLGTALLRAILGEATLAALPVRLYVEGFNPAQRLYARFGFTQIDEHGPYLKLEWRPPAR